VDGKAWKKGEIPERGKRGPSVELAKDEEKGS